MGQAGPVEAGHVKSFDGTRIAYEVFGRGTRAVLCCNGIACTAHAYWDPLAEGLSDYAKLVLWDYRGHGRSSAPGNSSEVILPSFARDALAVMDAAGLDKAVLVGHSIGVQVVLETYGLASERIEGLIAVAGPYKRPLGYLYGTRLGRVALPWLELATDLAETPFRLAWRVGFATPLPYLIARGAWMVGPRASPEKMETYFDGLGSMDPALLFRMFRAMDYHSAEEVLERIDVPVLVVAGSIDVLTPPRVAREMAGRIPNAELAVVRGAGHALPIEAPDQLIELISEFLSSHVWTDFAGTPRAQDERAAQDERNALQGRNAPDEAAGAAR